MAVEVRLNTEQFEYYRLVLDKAKVSFKHRGTLIELTKDSFHKILDTLKTSHYKALVLKTKTITTMEKLYYIEQVISILESQVLPHYPKEEPVDVVEAPVADNDTEVPGNKGTGENEDKEAA